MDPTLKGNWDALVEPPETVKVNAPLREVVRRLLEHEETRTLLVLDDEDRYVGVLSLANLLRYAEVLSGGGPTSVRDLVRFSQAQTARDVMFNPVSVPPSARLSDILKLMDDHRLPEIAVVDKGEVLGRVNSTKVLRLYLAEMRDM